MGFRLPISIENGPTNKLLIGSYSSMTICMLRFPSDGAIGKQPFSDIYYVPTAMIPGTNHPRVEHLRRVGKPKANWLYETYVDAFRAIDASNVFDPQNADNLQQRLSPFNNVRNYVLHHLQQAVAHDASHRRICHRISHRIPSSFWLSASLSFNYNLVKHP